MSSLPNRPTPLRTPLRTPPPPGPRIRVLQVVGNGIVGGMETWVTRLAEHLPRERFEVTALCPFEALLSEELRARDIECFVAPMPDDPTWAAVQMTCALVESRGIDVLHAHLPNAHVLAALAGNLTGRPVVSTIHGRQMSTLDLEVHRLADSYISTVCRQSYFHALGLGVKPSRLSCIANGVDTQRFTPRPADADRRGVRPGGAKAAFEGAAPWPADAPLIGFVGRFSPEKGPDVFVRAALLLKTRMPNARFVMVGDGPMHREMRTLVEHSGLADRVKLLGLRDDMPALYQELDVLASTSHSEAMPLALMEAMASGLPVVATRTGGVPDLVEQGRTGWVVTPGNFEGVANQIQAIVDTPGEPARMGQRARARAEAQFEQRQCIERVGELLAEVTRTASAVQSGPRRLDRVPRRSEAGAGGVHTGNGADNRANNRASNGADDGADDRAGNGATALSAGRMRPAQRL